MKINRTFSIDYDLAQKLKRKPNQSRIVVKAVRRFLANESQYSILDIPTRNLMAAITAREDCPRHIKVMLLEELTHLSK
jgi:hypothetical protein